MKFKMAAEIQKNNSIFKKLEVFKENVNLYENSCVQPCHSKEALEIAILEIPSTIESIKTKRKNLQELQNQRYAAIVNKNTAICKQKSRLLEKKRFEIRCKRNRVEVAEAARNNTSQNSIHRLQKYWLYLLSELPGLKTHSVEKNKIVLEFTSNEKDLDSLFMTMNFTDSGNSDFKLSNVDFSDQSIEAHKISETAIRNNDVPYLVTNIQQIWSKCRPLILEINELQKRFAIDWMHKENQLRMLKDGHVVCTLSVPDSTMHGHISLKTIKGDKESELLASLKPPQTLPSLTNWLEFLASYFQIQMLKS